jgi:hypothetical protein
MQNNQTNRKPVKIEAAFSDHWGHFYTAICDDGSVWTLTNHHEGWERLADIPQDEGNKLGDMK